MKKSIWTLFSLSVVFAQEMFLLPSQGKTNLGGEVIVNFSPKRDSIETEIITQFPRNSIQFVKLGKLYIARFRFSVAIYLDGELVQSRYLVDSIIGESYGTISENVFISSNPLRFLLNSQRYEIVAIFEDLNTGGKTEISKTIKIPSANTIKISRGWFYDPKTEKRITHNEITAEQESLSVYAKVFGIPMDANISAIIEGVRYRARRIAGFIKIENNDTFAVVSFPLRELTGGKYNVYLEIIRKDGKKWASTTLPFTLIPTANSLYKNRFDDLISVLRLIAQPSEIESLEKAEQPRSDTLWESFWRRKDPIPTTEQNEFLDEFEQRLKFVSINFSTPIRAGWETDRGRIYIQYGEPDEIDRHPFDINARPYEIWYYYSLGLTFLFVDTYGDGDYRLIEKK